MKRFDYFEKLSLAARWFLPQGEAESVIDDYRDILSEIGGPEEAKKRFGAPWRPVMELAEPKKVRRWHIAFLYMMFCTVFPIFYRILSGGYFDNEFCFNLLVTGLTVWIFWEILLAGKYSKKMLFLLGGLGSVLILFAGSVMPSYLLSIWDPSHVVLRTYEQETFAIGAAVSIVYFGFGKIKRRRFSKPLLAGMTIMFITMAGLYFFMYYSFYINIDKLAYHEGFFSVCFAFLLVFFFLSAIASIFLAKLYDRRWRVVFILALVGMSMCLELVVLSSINGFMANSGNMNLFHIFYNRNNPDYIFSNRWGNNITAIDEIFISFSWYSGVGTGLALIGLL